MIDWPTRSDAAKLSDEQLLEKLQRFGLEVDRAELERVCEGALSAEEVARPLLDRCGAGDREGRPHEDWMWLCLLEPGFRASPRGSIIRGWSPTEIRPQLAASAVGRRPSVPLIERSMRRRSASARSPQPSATGRHQTFIPASTGQ